MSSIKCAIPKNRNAQLSGTTKPCSAEDQESMVDGGAKGEVRSEKIIALFPSA